MKESYTVKLVSDENGDIILPLPEELMEKMLWRVGDVLDFQLQGRDQLQVENKSIHSMYASKLRRDLNTVIRRINSQTDPLNRVVIKKRCGKTVTVRAVMMSPGDCQGLEEAASDNS